MLQRHAPVAAEVELRAALDINYSLAGADNWRTARSQAGLACAMILRNDAVEGEPMLVAARDRLLMTVGRAHPATQWASAHLVEYLRARHRDAEAAQVLAAG